MTKSMLSKALLAKCCISFAAGRVTAPAWLSGRVHGAPSQVIDVHIRGTGTLGDQIWREEIRLRRERREEGEAELRREKEFRKSLEEKIAAGIQLPGNADDAERKTRMIKNIYIGDDEDDEKYVDRKNMSRLHRYEKHVEVLEEDGFTPPSEYWEGVKQNRRVHEQWHINMQESCRSLGQTFNPDNYKNWVYDHLTESFVDFKIAEAKIWEKFWASRAFQAQKKVLKALWKKTWAEKKKVQRQERRQRKARKEIRDAEKEAWREIKEAEKKARKEARKARREAMGEGPITVTRSDHQSRQPKRPAPPAQYASRPQAYNDALGKTPAPAGVDPLF